MSVLKILDNIIATGVCSCKDFSMQQTLTCYMMTHVLLEYINLETKINVTEFWKAYHLHTSEITYKPTKSISTTGIRKPGLCTQNTPIHIIVINSLIA